MLKHLFLQNCRANQSQIVCEASLDRWDENFFVASGSHDQNGVCVCVYIYIYVCVCECMYV